MWPFTKKKEKRRKPDSPEEALVDFLLRELETNIDSFKLDEHKPDLLYYQPTGLQISVYGIWGGKFHTKRIVSWQAVERPYRVETILETFKARKSLAAAELLKCIEYKEKENTDNAE